MQFVVSANQAQMDFWRERFMIDPSAPKQTDPLADMEWESGGGG